jgi:hypothetical protein
MITAYAADDSIQYCTVPAVEAVHSEVFGTSGADAQSQLRSVTKKRPRSASYVGPTVASSCSAS